MLHGYERLHFIKDKSQTIRGTNVLKQSNASMIIFSLRLYKNINVRIALNNWNNETLLCDVISLVLD
jgi:hypothetical protein